MCNMRIAAVGPSKPHSNCDWVRRLWLEGGRRKSAVKQGGRRAARKMLGSK